MIDFDKLFCLAICVTKKQKVNIQIKKNMNSSPIPQILWQPSKKFAQNSRLQAFIKWLNDKHQLSFSNYDELWEWSVENTKDFWAAVWEYFAVISHSPYTEIHTDDPMPDTRWFPGATLNY
ncbi:MAG: hypothetical protein KDD63_15145, partial [Bacteroidetes bacterium]|nr:hypothetical protein [Bacteroidota bacterium]